MAKRRLNKKVALIGSAVFVVVVKPLGLLRKKQRGIVGFIKFV